MAERRTSVWERAIHKRFVGGLLESRAHTSVFVASTLLGVAEKLGIKNKMDPSSYSQPKKSKKP